MVSRRDFMLLSGATALLTTCKIQQAKYVPPPKEGNTLEDVILEGLEHLREKDYPTARSYFDIHRKHRGGLTTQSHLDFLYAMSQIPDGSIFNGQYAESGVTLTNLFYRIKNNPGLLTSMQKELKPFFDLPDYSKYKNVLEKRLTKRYQMFYFLLNLIEEDYPEAQKGLKRAYKHLDFEEQHSVDYTISVLTEHAENLKEDCRAKEYKALKRIIN